MATAALSKAPATARPYQPFGAALDLMRFRGPEAILDGPAGTGKSRGCLEYLYALANAYPGCRLLMVRKTRASCTQSVLVTWEEKVVPFGHPCLKGPTRMHRQSYVFPNGSEVAVGGMDNATRIMSTEWDVIYVAEAIELTEDEWETLSTRLRNGVVPWQQMIGDTNPDSPRHWIKQREKLGKLRLINSRHEDNPTVWNIARNCPTLTGAAYLAKLDNLSGVRKARLRHGRWVQAEGVVYEDWDSSVHQIFAHELPTGWQQWPRIWTVDFGFRDPFVWQDWARGPDRVLYRIREIYKTHTLVEDHAREILAVTGRKMQLDAQGRPTGHIELTRQNPDPLPIAVVCDHDAEGRATLERHTSLQTIAAYKAITEGVQAVAARLRPDETGLGTKKPRVYYVRDGRIHPPDEHLAEAKAPLCTEDEYDSYIWDQSGGKKRGELPVDKDNHGMDTTRYCVAYVDEIDKGVRSWADSPDFLATLRGA